jgi:hypothetical protein
MSTLVAQTISNGTVSTSSANCIRGSARAWLRYNGATQTINNSYNVSSVTYNSAGIYTINFTNAMADANYSVCGTGGSWNVANSWLQVNPNIFSSTQFQLANVTSGGAAQTNMLQLAVFSL